MCEFITVGALLVTAVISAGPPAFGPGSTTQGLGQSSTSIAVGDFNNDGLTDFAVASTLNLGIAIHFATAEGGYESSLFPLPAPAPPCEWSPFFDYVYAFPYAIEAIDLGNDGDDDLVVACRGTWSFFNGISVVYGNYSSVVVFQNQNGALSAASICLDAPPFGVPESQAYVPIAASIGKGDLDGDGDIDLVIPIGKHAQMLLQTPSGLVLGDAFGFSSDSTIDCVAVGQVIPGGLNEIVFTDRLADRAQVWRRSSPAASPTLFQTVNLPSGARPVGLAISDLNGDGFNDLVIAGNAIVAGPAAWFRCLGSVSGSLGAPIATPLPSNGRMIAVSDLNLDGPPEVLVSHGNRVSMFSGTGATLGELLLIGAASHRAVGLSVFDRNMDCRPDVFFVNRDTNVVQWHHNLTSLDAPDCDSDAVVDWCEIALGLEVDRNGDGVPDSCQGLPGDVNDDGLVNGADLAIVLGGWGSCDGCPPDLNGDGLVDGADLSIVLGNWAP